MTRPSVDPPAAHDSAAHDSASQPLRDSQTPTDPTGIRAVGVGTCPCEACGTPASTCDAEAASRCCRSCLRGRSRHQDYLPSAPDSRPAPTPGDVVVPLPGLRAGDRPLREIPHEVLDVVDYRPTAAECLVVVIPVHVARHLTGSGLGDLRRGRLGDLVGLIDLTAPPQHQGHVA